MNGSTLPSPVEIASSLYGAWRLFLGDERGLDFLRRDREGFWTALWTLAFAVPPYVLTIALDPDRRAALGIGGLIVEGEVLILSGLIYAWGMYYVLPQLDRAERYFDFMVAHLWVGMSQVYIHVLPSLLRASGAVPEQAVTLITMALIFAMLWWSWFVTRTALDVTGGQAGVVVAGTVLYEFTIVMVFSNLYRSPLSGG